MKSTRHNGRSANGKAYSVKHNDRKFDVENAEHIDEARAPANIYWDLFRGFYLSPPGGSPDEENSFETAEAKYYHVAYRDFIEGQNERNAKNRHTERNRTSEDLRSNKKTCPEETIYQIGMKDDHVSAEVLLEIVSDYLNRFEDLFGSKVRILDVALHVDEATPHIHERHVFETVNQYGELCPQQEKALEELGFDLPDPDKKPGRYNNRKISFDSACRAMLFDICKEYGLTLNEEPEYGGRKYLEKQDFIREKQKKEIADANREIEQKEEKLDELNVKIGDFESLLDDVSETAYDIAVEVVTDEVRDQTTKENLMVIDDYQKKLNSPESGLTPKALKLVNNIFDGIRSSIGNAAKKIGKSLETFLKKPAVRSAGIEEVKTGARESVLARLKAGQDEIRKREQEGRANRADKANDKNKDIER